MEIRPAEIVRTTDAKGNEVVLDLTPYCSRRNAGIETYELAYDERVFWDCAMNGEISMGQAIRWAVRNDREGFAALLRAS